MSYKVHIPEKEKSYQSNYMLNFLSLEQFVKKEQLIFMIFQTDPYI